MAREVVEAALVRATIRSEGNIMGTTELIVLIVVVLLLFGGGGGYYWRRGR